MLSAAAVYLYHTVSFCVVASHGATTIAVRQGVRLVTATNGASMCACVAYVGGRAILNTTFNSIGVVSEPRKAHVYRVPRRWKLNKVGY